MQKYKECRRERDDVIDCEQPWRKPKAEKQNKSAAAAVGIQWENWNLNLSLNSLQIKTEIRNEKAAQRLCVQVSKSNYGIYM